MDSFSRTGKAILAALWLFLISSLVVLVVVFNRLDANDVKLAASDGDTIVSLELAFTADRADKIIRSWITADLHSTAVASIHWDWAFITAYLALMLCISGLVRRAKHPPPPSWSRMSLILLPWAVAFSDAVENLGIYYLLGSQQGVLFSVVTFLVSLFAAVKFLFLFVFVVIVIRARYVDLRIFSLVRFSLLMLAVGVASLFTPQWQEVLLAISEELDSARHLSFWLGFASLVAAITTWYSARVMFMLEIPGQAELCSRKTAPFLKKWLPRALGWAVLLLISIGLYRSAMLALEPVLSLATAWILYSAFVLWRRLIPYFDIGPAEETFGCAKGWLKLPRPTRMVLGVLVLFNVTAFLFALADPLLARSVGGAAVVLCAVGLMVPFGTWLVYWGARWKLPVLLILITLAILLSLFNDNHWVRLAPEASSTDGAQPLVLAEPVNDNFKGLEQYTGAWARSRAQSTPDDLDIPLIIVSAEGGGIRAAYWTAQVLARLQDIEPRFSRHLFAISGVSGGSLGGAVFAAQVASGTPPGEYTMQADKVLREDFLAPTLASLLFPDLLQRFLPWPLFEDRAVTLERSWETAWRTAADGDDTFADSFAMLWSGNELAGETDATAGLGVPLLFLNSTVVETGNRLIMQPLAFSGNEGGFNRIFKDAIDGRTALGTELPLSTAVHLSARFTYVSPAGSARNHSLPEYSDAAWIRLVDGGYFENSGTVTSTELLGALRRMIDASGIDSPLARLRPFIVHISNDPVKLHSAGREVRRSKQAALGEVLSPLLALLHARPARGYQARDALFGLLDRDKGSPDYVHFRLYDLGTTLPLGWVLSSTARLNIQAQLNELTGREMHDQPVEDSGKMREARRRNQFSVDRVLRLWKRDQ